MKDRHDYQLAIALLIMGIVLLLVLAGGALVAVQYGGMLRSPTPQPILQMT